LICCNAPNGITVKFRLASNICTNEDRLKMFFKRNQIYTVVRKYKLLRQTNDFNARYSAGLSHSII
jgi:hypothetical protein